MKVNAIAITAALAAKGYGNTTGDFTRYLEDNHEADTPLNTVVRGLDPEWNGDFGALTVGDAEAVEEIMQLIGGDEKPVEEFLNDAPQIDG